MKGTLNKTGREYLLRFERFYPHPPEEVWSALVEPSRLAQWFPAAIVGERRTGAVLKFVFQGEEGPALDGLLRIFEPPRLLEYSWGTDVLRWELASAPGGCALVFTTTVAQRSNAPRDATGWEGCLDNLEAAVSGGAASPPSADQFAERYRGYSAAFGMGAFPEFLVGETRSPRRVSPKAEEVPNAQCPTNWGHEVLVGSGDRGTAPLLSAPGLAGQTYAAPSGARLAVLHATSDAEVAPYSQDGDGYLFVIEGSYLLRLGEHELALAAGTEFHIPGGGRVSGRVAAGTRMFYAIAPREG